jgi:hypothetical protein
MVKSAKKAKASKGGADASSRDADSEDRKDPGKSRDYDKSRYNRKL